MTVWLSSWGAAVFDTGSRNVGIVYRASFWDVVYGLLPPNMICWILGCGILGQCVRSIAERCKPMIVNTWAMPSQLCAHCKRSLQDPNQPALVCQSSTATE